MTMTSPGTHPPSPTVAPSWEALVELLFGADHGVQRHAELLHGSASFGGQTLQIIGTADHAFVNVELALAQARCLLDCVASHPGRPILLLVDTQGQALRRRDELLGLQRAMAHLAACVDLARRRGHRVLALVYDQALSGGFLGTGLMADACDALPAAEIRVMRIPAMSRVIKVPQERLQALAAHDPVFAPGAANYVAMGAVRALWQGDLREALRQALADADAQDRRAELGAHRGGRPWAAPVIRQVLAEPAGPAG
jgi:malonate decarboxylase gamma subunit